MNVYDSIMMEERNSDDSSEDTDSSSELIYTGEDDEDVDDDMIEDRIFHAERRFMDQRHINGHYYLGNTFLPPVVPARWLMDTALSPAAFFRFAYRDILSYLGLYSIHYRRNITHVEVMQLNIRGPYYEVVLKTHWLRLVQRHWKRIYQERKRVIQTRKTVANYRHRELRGRHLPGANYLPGLRGMMQCYVGDDRGKSVKGQ